MTIKLLIMNTIDDAAGKTQEILGRGTSEPTSLKSA
jgi:hypothetical protein